MNPTPRASHEQPPQVISFRDVTIESGFWGERQATNRNNTIPAIYRQNKITGRLDAWHYDGHPEQPKPHIFWDSDTAKWIEAVAYSVATHPNPEFERQADEVITWIAQAQLPDGYANSHFLKIEPQNRWRNLRDEHELYCAGHLIEGAIAYAQSTGKRQMLDVLIRYANHIDATFGAGGDKKRGYPGHPELELALIRLYHETGEQRYLNLSRFFVDERGQQPHYYDLEAHQRGEDPRRFWARDYRYCQAHEPVRAQTEVTGHSVRACYLYSAVTDLALETGDAGLLETARTLWDDLTQRQMYITGGVGAQHTIEGFTYPYDLPNETAYGETCASISVIYWAQRLFRLDPDSRYYDVIERALYNGVISGVSYEGTHFFQANPLASYPHISPYSRLDDMAASTYYRRTEWFDVACCPSNLARIVASLGDYFYSVTPDRLYVHLYNQNRTHTVMHGHRVEIEQMTNYPWDGEINLHVTAAQSTRFELALRIPGWCRDFLLEVNGAALDTQPERGYVVIAREWGSSDTVTLTLKLPIERMIVNPRVREDAGQVALQRGPIVYCLEEVDNGAELASVTLPRTAHLTYRFSPDLFGGIGTISGDALRDTSAEWGDHLYRQASQYHAATTPFTLTAIPYCFWANRQPGEMRVWVRES